MSAFARAGIIVKAPYWGFFVSAENAVREWSWSDS
jgi:hypothetical protein